MHVFMSPEFQHERERYNLVFTCEACRHYREDGEACAVLYPTKPHRDKTVASLSDGERLYFCKMFEAD